MYVIKNRHALNTKVMFNILTFTRYPLRPRKVPRSRLINIYVKFIRPYETLCAANRLPIHIEAPYSFSEPFRSIYRLYTNYEYKAKSRRRRRRRQLRVERVDTGQKQRRPNRFIQTTTGLLDGYWTGLILGQSTILK